MRKIFRLAMMFILLGANVSAQPDAFAGRWQGSFNGVQITITMEPNMRYQQTLAEAPAGPGERCFQTGQPRFGRH